MSKKKLKAGESNINSIKKCKNCVDGVCSDIQTKESLNDFKDVQYCGHSMVVLKYSKADI